MVWVRTLQTPAGLQPAQVARPPVAGLHRPTGALLHNLGEFLWPQIESTAFSDPGGNVAVKRVGETGRLYGSVTSRDIAQKLEESTGIEVDSRGILLAEPIRELGSQSVTIRFTRNVSAAITVTVDPDEDSKEIVEQLMARQAEEEAAAAAAEAAAAEAAEAAAAEAEAPAAEAATAEAVTTDEEAESPAEETTDG